jgi:hypothetical protein
VSRSWKDAALDGPRSPKYTRSKFKYTPEEREVSDTVEVFVIINEWTDIANDTSSEVTGGRWFASEDEAWDALDLIAQAHNVELGPDETSLQLEDHKSGLQSEEYRIEELTRG